MLLACVTWEMRVQQRVIEDDGRKIIGEWLRANAAPGDRIFLEPLGYVGYYSHLKAYDYPGLTSREVVTAIREGATTIPSLLPNSSLTGSFFAPWRSNSRGSRI
jgi:hypothetical protein